MKIGDRIFVRGYIDEIRKDTVIVRNDGGYFGTIPSEVITGELPSAQPECKTGHWILDRSGAYCCDKCMEPCASYAMMKPRDKFCKMCGSRNEVVE